MKLLVTGYNGFVGGSILAQAPYSWEVLALGRSQPLQNSPGIIYHQADITDHAAMQSILESVIPDAVIHTAAIANIDFCEANPVLAENINYRAVELLANHCSKFGSKLIHCSTDTVFDGKKGMYTETEIPVPVNVYAETKVKAEKAVGAAGNNHVIARLALVMGLPVMGRGNSFLADLLEKLKKGESLKFAINEIRTPIDVITLGAALLELAASDYSGIIHLAGNSSVTRFDMAKRIAGFAGFPDSSILPINSNEIAGRAPRPDDVSLNNSLSRKILKTPMHTLEEGLEITLHQPVNRLNYL